MKKYAKINYAQRPQSYWDDQDLPRALLRNVKGTQRRLMITDYWKQGRLPELHEELLKDTLSEDVRERLGRIDLAFMGGEYLPDYKATEVEIARMELASTTSDVISIRAMRDPEGIRYRIVDEYETEFRQPFETSHRPLSLQQLIELIEVSDDPHVTGSLALAYNDMNAEGSSRAAMRDFTVITSEFYPQLYEHFEHVFDDWVSEEEQPVRDGTLGLTKGDTPLKRRRLSDGAKMWVEIQEGKRKYGDFVLREEKSGDASSGRVLSHAVPSSNEQDYAEGSFAGHRGSKRFIKRKKKSKKRKEKTKK